MEKRELRVSSREPEAVSVDLSSLPQNESDSLSRVILKGVEKAFEDPAIAADFKEWKQQRGHSAQETAEQIKRGTQK